MHKKYLQKILIINILFFTFSLNFFQIPFCQEKCEIYNNHQKKKYQLLYQKCNKQYCKYLNNLTTYQTSKQKNQNIYPLTPNNLLEMQISNNFVNLKNIYLNNDKQLIFHQLGYQFMNRKKIYNFGLGYRNCYYDQWIIGNNIFYDTLFSNKNKKILSIGHEFLKGSVHLTVNTYHEISNNNFICIHKKFLPFSYDIHIKNRLPFFINTYGTFNIEHHFNDNSSKLTIGLNYTPISMFTFNIDKIISNSMKNCETKFNILVNYKINIPWKHQKNNTDDHLIKYTKIWSISNEEFAIYRNNSILFNENINFDKIVKITKNHKKYIETKIQQKKLEEHSSLIEVPENDYYSKNKKNTLFYTPCNLNEESSNSTLSTLEASHANTKLNSKIQIYLTNTTDQPKNNNDINTVHDNEPDSKTINDNYENQIMYPKHTNNSHLSSQKNHQLLNPETKSKELNATHHHVTPNIPSPPPILNLLKISNQDDNFSTMKNDNSENRITNHDDKLDNLRYDTETIKKHKRNKFSSLGSEEHLLKLSNVSKKRKKTISTSSNDSNDSESIRLLKIIERQSILSINNDTDSDDKDSSTSHNEFSE